MAHPLATAQGLVGGAAAGAVASVAVGDASLTGLLIALGSEIGLLAGTAVDVVREHRGHH